MEADLHARAAVKYVPVALENEIDFGHSIESMWSTERLNNINKHFVLATMDCHIKQQEQACVYLQLAGDYASDQTPYYEYMRDVFKLLSVCSGTCKLLSLQSLVGTSNDQSLSQI